MLLAWESELKIENIRYPKSTSSIVGRDIAHRVSFVNTQISYDRWRSERGLKNVFFHTYFDKVGSNRNASINGFSRAITRLELGKGVFTEPDGIFCYLKNDIPKFFLLEVHNGNDSERALEQLRSHCFAILEGIASDK